MSSDPASWRMATLLQLKAWTVRTPKRATCASRSEMSEKQLFPFRRKLIFLVVEIWNPQQKHVISPLYREKFCFSPFTRWPITTTGSRPAVCQHPAPSVGVSLCSKHLSWSCTCLGWVLRSDLKKRAAPIHWVLEYSGAAPGSWRLGARAQTGGPPQVLAKSKQSIESVNLGCQSQVLANQLWMVSQFFSKPEKRADSLQAHLGPA